MFFSKEFVVIGHRGAPNFRPENTLSSFEYAIDAGVDAIELDVHLVEGQLIVIHDGTLERTTNGSGSIYTKSLRELREFDAGAGQRIPLLRDVIEFLPPEIGLNVELKGTDTARPLLELLQTTDFDQSKLLVSSFRLAELQELKTLDGGIQLAYLRASFSANVLAEASQLRAVSLNLLDACVTSDTVDLIHANGLRILAFTVNDPSRISELRDLGADGVFTDNPHFRHQAYVESLIET